MFGLRNKGAENGKNGCTFAANNEDPIKGNMDIKTVGMYTPLVPFSWVFFSLVKYI